MNSATILLQQFVGNWLQEFPDCPMTVADLKKPHAVMQFIFCIFDRLGIDKDYIQKPPPEDQRNDHVTYYWDLLPVINMTRVINHLVYSSNNAGVEALTSVSITHFLQPTIGSSNSVLLVLINLLIFNETRLDNVKKYEDEIFEKADKLKVLEEEKNELLVMVNTQAEEKGKRAERVEKLEVEIKKLEDESKVEQDTQNEEQQELDMITIEYKQMEVTLEQKRGQRDALISEIDKKKALRVYDADDIKAQVEQAAQNVEDADEKLKALKETLTQKENSLKNLHTVKPNLDTANTLLHEISKLLDNLRDLEYGDLEFDSNEGELDVFNTELSELELQLADIRAARREAADKRQEAQARRHQESTAAQSNLRDAEERDKVCKERCKKASARAQEHKELAPGYEREKAALLAELARTQEGFVAELKNMNETLLKKAIEGKKKIETKLKNRSI